MFCHFERSREGFFDAVCVLINSRAMIVLVGDNTNKGENNYDIVLIKYDRIFHM